MRLKRKHAEVEKDYHRVLRELKREQESTQLEIAQNNELSTEVDSLESAVETLNQSLQSMTAKIEKLENDASNLSKFKLPCSLMITEWTILDMFGFSDELQEYAEQKLIQGLAMDFANLNQVARYMSLKLESQVEGNWVSVIEPYDVETGWILN